MEEIVVRLLIEPLYHWRKRNFLHPLRVQGEFQNTYLWKRFYLSLPIAFSLRGCKVLNAKFMMFESTWIIYTCITCSLPQVWKVCCDFVLLSLLYLLLMNTTLMKWHKQLISDQESRRQVTGYEHLFELVCGFFFSFCPIQYFAYFPCFAFTLLVL